jgi:hypothetical protein
LVDPGVPLHLGEKLAKVDETLADRLSQPVTRSFQRLRMIGMTTEVLVV